MEAQIALLQSTATTDRNRDYELQLDSLKKQVHQIDIWLAFLDERPRFVLEQHLIEGLSFPEIAEKYQQKHGASSARTSRTFMNDQKAALHKIARLQQSVLSMASD